MIKYALLVLADERNELHDELTILERVDAVVSADRIKELKVNISELDNAVHLLSGGKRATD